MCIHCIQCDLYDGVNETGSTQSSLSSPLSSSSLYLYLSIQMWQSSLLLLSTSLYLIEGQSGGASALGVASGDATAMAANMQKFAELYGFATQMVNLGGSFIRGGSGSGSSNGLSSSYSDFTPSQSSSSSSYPSYSNFGGNGILSDFVKPNGRGMMTGMSQDDSMLARAATNLLSEYGGLSTASRSQSPPPRGQSGFQSLLNTFLGSSVSEENLPPPPTPRPRPQRSLFEQFLGGSSSSYNEDKLPPPPPPSKRLMPSFADLLSPSYDSKPTQQLNFLELLGMERPTTTTTRRPLLIFDRNEKYGLGQGASDIDGILNALMRSGARPSVPTENEQPSSAGLLASFLG